MKYRCLLPLLLLSLLARAARAQAERPLTSSIETIAGGEPASILGPEFNLLALSGIAADFDGNVYFSVQAQSRVYRRGRDGRVTAYAGNGVRGKQVDGEPAVSSPLLNPYALATDADGNLYITCANALLVVDVGAHTISKVFDLPYRESGALELIHDIESMVISPDGKLYFTDGGDHRIKTFSFTTHSVGIVAGNGNIWPGTARRHCNFKPSSLSRFSGCGFGWNSLLRRPRAFRLQHLAGRWQAPRD